MHIATAVVGAVRAARPDMVATAGPLTHSTSGPGKAAA
jgi:hypothetical protein